MLAVYVATSSVSLSWGQLIVIAFTLLCVMAACKTRPMRVAVVIAAVVALGATVALAIPYAYCDPIWKYFGWCK
jgi:hypothetical protein